MNESSQKRFFSLNNLLIAAGFLLLLLAGVVGWYRWQQRRAVQTLLQAVENSNSIRVEEAVEDVQKWNGTSEVIPHLVEKLDGYRMGVVPQAPLNASRALSMIGVEAVPSLIEAMKLHFLEYSPVFSVSGRRCQIVSIG